MPPTNDYRISGESPSPPPPKPKTKILSIFLVGVIMFSIFFLFLVLIGIASVLILPLLLSSLHRHHRRRRRNRRQESSDGLSSRFVKKLPQFKFSEPTTYTRYESDCVVCFDGFRQGQWCRNLPGCGHVFHRKCVDTWLLKSSTCPICRARVRLREEDAHEGELWRCFGHRRRSLLDLRGRSQMDDKNLHNQSYSEVQYKPKTLSTVEK